MVIFDGAMRKNTYDKTELVACGEGRLFSPEHPRLPVNEMLMFDRIIDIHQTGGAYDRGWVLAQLDIRPDLWFFDCHFQKDPVMPGCLGLDALWQLVGFYLGWLDFTGKGRALSVGQVKFFGQILPEARLVEFRLDMKRIFTRGLPMGLADGKVSVDGKPIYSAENLRVGIMPVGAFDSDQKKTSSTSTTTASD